jgi:hypothetical protein
LKTDAIGNKLYNNIYNTNIIIHYRLYIINYKSKKDYYEIFIQLSGNRSFTLLAAPFHILG